MSVSETIKNSGRLTFSIKPLANVLKVDLSSKELSPGNLGRDYMIPVGRYEMLYRFAGIQEVLDILQNVSCKIWKKFHPGKAGSLFCTVRILLWQDKTFPCNHFSPPKSDEKVI